MAMLLAFLFASASAQLHSPKTPPDIGDFQEALRKISQIKDEISIKLNDTNFEHETQAATGATTGDWFVYFFLPGCQKCTLFTPQWKFFAERVKEEKDLQLNIAKVNINDSPQLARRFNIDRFPTLLYFSQGYYYNYTGPSDEDSLFNAVESNTVKTSKRRAVPPELTPLREWFLFLKWWAVKGPGLYPKEACLVGLGAVFVLYILYKLLSKCGRKEAKAEEREEPASKKRSEG